MAILNFALVFSVIFGSFGTLEASTRIKFSDCRLSLKEDFGTPSPVYLQNGQFLNPNPGFGDIRIKLNGAVKVACPGNQRYLVLGNDTTDVSSAEAKCLYNSTFRIGRWNGPFSHIRCNTLPWFTAEDVAACGGSHRLYKVGYKIDDVLYTLYEACFAKTLLSTLYVKHTISPSNQFVQTGPRPNFIEGDVFGKTSMSHLYKLKNQKARVKILYGPTMEEVYLTKSQFLNRGHLAPRADFSMWAEQRASFHYINVAPQWMRGNAGDWAALEEGLRRRVRAYNATVTVYTGTHGVLQLSDKERRMVEFYLGSDANNNDIVPVPLYYYKLVYDPRRKTAAAFVSINSSFYNSTLLNELTFCKDICDGDNKYSWLRWRSNDGTFSFCCDYEEFAAKMNHLPKLKPETKYTGWYSEFSDCRLSLKEDFGTPSPVYLQNGQFLNPNPGFGDIRIKLNGAVKVACPGNQRYLVLGNDTTDVSSAFLNRGHLAPRADFSMWAEQRASFHYINVAPQWMRGNAGDWAALEEGLRRRVRAYNATVTVYTGTHGVLQLSDKERRMVEFYLGSDANNNDIVPVPLYYYKLVYDPRRKTAAAFVSINSSFYNSTLLNELTFCKDICDGDNKYSWLRWRSNDGTFSFCCDYEEFAAKMNHLPKLKVAGLFY